MLAGPRLAIHQRGRMQPGTSRPQEQRLTGRVLLRPCVRQTDGPGCEGQRGGRGRRGRDGRERHKRRHPL